MESFAAQLNQPCEVAVVGRVKAGKSTFINALLGAEDELAKVGATETTATINYFRFGQPNPDKPVRCYWRNPPGSFTDVNREFLNGLQGNDLETLRRADAIHYLEYYLPNKYLEQGIVLVDTPGIGAVVDTHQNRTAEYMQLYQQLRERHDLDTQKLDSKADAVIYLTDAVARVTDSDFLKDFHSVTQGRSKPHNAIGVVARIDEQPQVLVQRHELSAKIARQLKQHLNTVVPVSGGLQFALCRLGRPGLLRLLSAFSRVQVRDLDKLLSSEGMYRVKSRALGLGDLEELIDSTIPWSVFTTIVRRLVNSGGDLDKAEAELYELAGFNPLKEVLERHFFQRAAYLRCFRIAEEARSLLRNITYRELPKLKARDREDQAQRERFLAFIQSAKGEVGVANELREFLSRVCGVNRRSERLESDLSEWCSKLDQFYRELEEHNADFEALQVIDAKEGLFNHEEIAELYPLFGRYGIEIEKRLNSRNMNLQDIGKRQQRWRQIVFSDRNVERVQVAERAVIRYGLILHELSSRS